MGIIKAFKLGFDYLKYDEDGNVQDTQRAVDDVNLDIEAGDFVAILGHNGSGKSTLAKHMNALLLPSEGTIWVDDMDTSKEQELWKIRQKAGMVFQNPDNQIIGTSVEEDVAFGPENKNLEPNEIQKRVTTSLKEVGLLEKRKASPFRLSGGQKQRVAIAGVLAGLPKCIVLDEPTAMLDPKSRKEVLQVVHELNKQKGITVILITHHTDEVVDADQIIVMDKGHIIKKGTPTEIFQDLELLRSVKMDVPQVTELAQRLYQDGVPLELPVLTEEQFLEQMMKIKNHMEGGIRK